MAPQTQKIIAVVSAAGIAAALFVFAAVTVYEGIFGPAGFVGKDQAKGTSGSAKALILRNPACPKPVALPLAEVPRDLACPQPIFVATAGTLRDSHRAEEVFVPVAYPFSAVAKADGITDELRRRDEPGQTAVQRQQARRFVTSMAYDPRGYVWVGCEDSGIWRLDLAKTGEGAWSQFSRKDGLGDDNIYAVAVDRLGRVWVGHLNHGVSVYNGAKWQNYEVVGGLSTPTSLSGPLGERVFCIAVCPTDGDVWIGSSCGLARYSEKQDTWRVLHAGRGASFGPGSGHRV